MFQILLQAQVRRGLFLGIAAQLLQIGAGAHRLERLYRRGMGGDGRCMLLFGRRRVAGKLRGFAAEMVDAPGVARPQRLALCAGLRQGGDDPFQCRCGRIALRFGFGAAA